MGCDIHMYIEIKTKNGWELYSHPNMERNYKLFSKLADVRNDYGVKPISKPRGIPEDTSYIVKACYEHWGVSAHSASYITCEEIYELQTWLYDNKPFGDDGFISPNDLEHSILHTYLEGDSFACVYKYPEDKPEWIEDVRFVFWFDN